MNLNKKIGFLCDIPIPNYETDPKFYDYLEGKHSATGYYYWILKNGGVEHVYLIDQNSDFTEYDVIVFHYDNLDLIDFSADYKKIQVVTDCPQVENCDLYICCNYSSFKLITDLELFKRVGFGLKNQLYGNLHYVHYPMALNYKKCDPVFPPKIYHFTGRESTLIDDIASVKFINHMKQYDINLRFDFKNDHNNGDEDVYFCVRSKNYFSKRTKGNNCDTKLGQKTANRLYQSWKMGVPFITNSNSAMFSIKQSEYDFLIADTLDEFEQQCIRLKKDEELYNKMILNANNRKNEHTNEIIIQQWIHAFEKISTTIR